MKGHDSLDTWIGKDGCPHVAFRHHWTGHDGTEHTYVPSARREVVLVNPSERDWKRNRFVLVFGTYGGTYLAIWEDCLEDAIETAGAYLADHAPGLIMAHDSEELATLYREAAEEHGVPADQEGLCSYTDAVHEAATADLTYTESGYLTSYEWGIALEGWTRDEFFAFVRGGA